MCALQLAPVPASRDCWRSRAASTRSRACAAVLQRLAKALEDIARELAELVEEQHAVMGEADLAGRRKAASADQARSGHVVVRRSERASAGKPAVELPGDRLYARD